METVRALRGLVDIYLPDFKYAESQLSLAYSGAEDYALVAKAALLEMAEKTGKPVFGADGMLRSGTMVRHLILPGHTRNSLMVLEWLAENMGERALISLMAQYVPCGKAPDYPKLNRRITQREYEKVQQRLFELGLDGFVQERSSSKKEYIPDFNLEGVAP